MSDSYIFFGRPSIIIKTGKECVCSIDKRDICFDVINPNAKINPVVSEWTARDGLMYDIGKIIVEELEKNNEPY